jgi:hypothetical protein
MESNSFALITSFLKYAIIPNDLDQIKIYTRRETFGLIESTIHLVLNISELLPGNCKKLFGQFGIFQLLTGVL